MGRCWEVEPRDVIYMETRLRTPSTDQSTRRLPHLKKCMRTANCFIGRYLGQGSTFTRSPDSISAVMTIVFVCGDPVVNPAILPLLYSDTLLPQLA
ncbi:hypothetical protein TNCV_2403681 [Trichonephila clavipes]|uniref:Uncharacterized protein n=1 Tax=Trichonephila clavipes TaxID=2585209 RepID=A0A8X6UVW2_TRICX|nr:hypothetical protein TNCV_2403681 [Trichonephila clavipes]